MVTADPVALTQLVDLGAFESAGMTIADVLETGGELELGAVKARRQGAILLPEPLPFDQQAEPGFEVQVGEVGLAALFFQGLGHAVEPEGVKFVERRMGEHKPGGDQW